MPSTTYLNIRLNVQKVSESRSEKESVSDIYFRVENGSVDRPDTNLAHITARILMQKVVPRHKLTLQTAPSDLSQ